MSHFHWFTRVNVLANLRILSCKCCLPLHRPPTSYFKDSRPFGTIGDKGIRRINVSIKLYVFNVGSAITFEVFHKADTIHYRK